MTQIEQPQSGIWHELVLGPSRRRLLWGIAVGLGGTAALAPLMGSGRTSLGLMVVPVVLAALIGRLWPAVAASLSAFVITAVSEGSPAPSPYDYVVLSVLLAVGTLVAVEEAARARAGLVQRRLAFLAEANRGLTTSLDVRTTLAELIGMMVPRMADWAAVILRGPSGEAPYREVAHSDPRKVRLVQELWERYPTDLQDSPVAEVLSTGQPLVLRRVPSELIERAARDEEHLRLLRRLDLRSAIVVALRSPRGPVGILVLVHAESGRRYSEADLTFVEELARTASMAIENARLHGERSRIAQTLQNSLLPQDIPDIPGVDVAVRYRAAGQGNLVGGDFYDLFDVGKGAWAVALGDVCGKGPEAAALTGLVRHTIRTAAARDPRPSDVLSRVNAQILGTDNGRFCTVTLGTVRPANQHLDVTVSCGGHPPPLVLRPNRTVEAAECAGTLLGVFPDPELADSPVRLDSGDSIVFYTDGVTDRFERHGEVGDARLVALLGDCDGLDAGGIADRIYRETTIAAPSLPRDDIAIVVLRVPEAA